MFKTLCTWGYRIALTTLVAYAVYCYTIGGWDSVFHNIAYYIPAVALFLMFSGQADLLEKIRKGGEVNIKAQAIDFTHWFLLLFMQVGRWMMGGFTLWAFILMAVLLAIIGWQVGVGIGRQWYPSVGEKRGGIAMLVASAILGLVAGAVRHADPSTFGWGWMLETTTAIIATGIVVWVITNHIKTIAKKASDYPRSFFLKGVSNNVLEIWVLIHLLNLSYTGGVFEAWASNAGFAFNIIVGNAIYFVFYGLWEIHRTRQARRAVRQV
ncbi:hypothetical protein A3I46_00720 [Candidatus Kaiserbacteria bacterium RIFCSPLOWO2_02_FULL_54_13]|uniref:Uncharacterized protein n=1 Tax=Candidatus Kaiserbacteria bacterium RIFCSPHIGHO2_02_FULL_54_22 TaxID=1798495 RepID=A0A1F6DJ94_9BACT|nr:MAG: hypothetical protein UY89_C0022G0005 [Parcubacteria group bacterium GW2011_GWA1_54_9]KKW40711.1 MAG: hypothetical protein UY91_C0036G0010 [Parcubacteria group bacterium GW2011_GWB1_55_9]OGG61475.1 MAG: hypothetical protein A3C19_01830 [Candidatus Kaiserbacteria bacterium RIFCSPHIGHO2_02_FULL_54_22]OGG68576.1 MAG: hypothetical protein A3E99_00345 [Candidatus Kaiserbacteria bacterium RIFCSPHIGHO2_12_FULL_54_16]OGG82846.1 MAG: hypothetical protein A3I46_00720 [Candidatus Kaiserbacteria bac